MPKTRNVKAKGKGKVVKPATSTPIKLRPTRLSHAPSTQTTNPPTHESSTPTFHRFLDLPYELQLHISSYAVRSAKPIQIDPIDPATRTPHRRNTSCLTATSRPVRLYARPLFFRLNSFHFAGYWPGTSTLDAASQKTIPLMTHLHLDSFDDRAILMVSPSAA
ncbi:hypothetical protein MMC13_000899 [Lambiella insularis]|nr:hypothetical protein [Lambiella insularis]